MEFTNGTIITVKTKRYIIIETMVYDNKKYIFTNEIKGEEELTEDYYIFQTVDNDVILITNEEKLNNLLEKFQEKLKKTIDEFL